MMELYGIPSSVRPTLPSRLIVLATISLMVLLQTCILMMSSTKQQSNSHKSTSAGATDHGLSKYPFLDDPQAIKYISTQIKVMFFLHMTSGKETSALAKDITNTYKNSAICCFYNSRGSNDSPALGNVYQTCKNQIEDSCKKGLQVIVVNGTDREHLELQGYFTVAHQYNYTTVVVQPNATLDHFDAQRSPSEPIGDASKGQDLPKILYPFFYGWFLGFNISVDTQNYGRKIFHECRQQPKFVEIFKKYALPGSPRNSTGGLDFDRYFSLDGFITGTTLLHCTSFFSNYSERAGSQQYATSPAVRQGTGDVYNLLVIGFLITPRTFGARIRLSSEELCLWESNSTSGNLAAVGAASNADKIMQQKQLQRFSQEKLTFDLIIDNEVPCPKDWHPTKFSPTCGRGSRAHLTLGTGKDIEAQQTGSDLNMIILKELEAVAKKEDILTLRLESGTVRCYGEGNWAVYLDKPFEIGALFTGWY
ncbi:2',3'-cyclic-nucleotide 3'-phosphodiesterase-like isoform X2 [Acanthaster planci]|uniref:2',3'-cyclic-nucleotide 3'-phosphodiesterase-like isoform X2 n=1 Tax=Acanthaster planci TaxID=133434 RepID=A0A8B7Z8T3_ACAPL|nr:2',3'-cyclic-nucleotide 3'-phosphodiesterase-like isoform X2 [Acanthaster planci]